MVSIVLLWLLISFLDVAMIIQAFEFANPVYLSLGCMLIVANLASQIGKWHTLLKVVKNDATWFMAAKSVFFGNSIGAVTPGNLGEFLGRSLTVEHHAISHIVSLAIFDRLQTFIIMVTGFAIALPFFPIMTAELRWGISFAVLVLTAVAVLKARPLARWIANRRYFPLNHPLVQKGFEALRLLQPSVLQRTILYSILFYLIMGLQLFFYVRTFQPTDLVTAFLGFSAIMVAKSLLPISLADLGVREAASVYFFSLLGISNVAAFNAALMMFVGNIFLPSLFGVVFVPQIALRGSTNGR
ncbi:MAG TPA: lysylphosphatidylglycerol synthase transmembrane domain-containing protein [Bacteroidota bacterium]|nr:lysylphosphatidylglycerol synthase transmembrane domain-containing protein [Bacteroidota bacterium]